MTNRDVTRWVIYQAVSEFDRGVKVYALEYPGQQVREHHKDYQSIKDLVLAYQELVHDMQEYGG